MSTYTDQNLTNDIAWLYHGYNCGQRDDDRKHRAAAALHADDKRALRILTAFARRLLDPGDTIEDVVAFIGFLDHYLGYSL